MVTLTEEEAKFVFSLIMLAGNAYPNLQNDSSFMATAKAITDKVMNKEVV